MLRAALVLAAVVLVTAAAPAGAALKARGSVEAGVGHRRARAARP